MNKTILFLISIYLTKSGLAQTTEIKTSASLSDFVPYRTDLSISADSINLESFIGYWMALDGNSMVIISKKRLRNIIKR